MILFWPMTPEKYVNSQHAQQTVAQLCQLFGPFLSQCLSVLPYTFLTEQDHFKLAGRIQSFQYFLYRLLRSFPFLFPRHSLNHLSRNRSNHLRRWQRRYTISEYERDTIFRSCLSGALTCWCGCQLSLGRLAQGAAFLTHPRSRCLSNLLQWWSGS